jgi:hypothetical protein
MNMAATTTSHTGRVLPESKTQPTIGIAKKKAAT